MTTKFFAPLATFAFIGLFVVAAFVTYGTDFGRTGVTALGQAVLQQGDLLAGAPKSDASVN